MAQDGLRLSRRGFLPAATLAAPGCRVEKATLLEPAGNAAVFVARAASYSTALSPLIEAGIRACGLDVKGKRILLKPNLVEFDSATAVNTNVAILAAALDVFRRLRAASIRIGEGPGHRRDTLFLAGEADYRQGVEGFDNLFVDLNRDDVSAVAEFAGRKPFYLPNTALGADLIVSLPKMKTHHWAGATLSMKNLFGLVPGAVYGWPKNMLHQIGISRSIVELNRRFRNTFAIVDGIIAMEGNGPIQGTPKKAGVMVMGTDLVAVDATCCRIMGMDPMKLEYIQMARDLGHCSEQRIEQRGERIDHVRTPFSLIEEFRNVRLA